MFTLVLGAMNISRAYVTGHMTYLTSFYSPQNIEKNMGQQSKRDTRISNVFAKPTEPTLLNSEAAVCSVIKKLSCYLTCLFFMM